MADFSAAFTAGVTTETWDDPALSTPPFTPTRQNAFSETPHRQFKGTTGTPITVTATVPAFDGVAGEVDSNLGGRLFALHFGEVPQLPPPLVSNPGGQSSVQTFTPLYAGHYSLRMERIGATGGSVFLHVEVEDP